MYCYSYDYSFHQQKRNKRKVKSKINIFFYQKDQMPVYYAYVKWVKKPLEDTVRIGKYKHKDSKFILDIDKSDCEEQAYKKLLDFENSVLDKNCKYIFDNDTSYAGILHDYNKKKISKRVLKYRYRRIEELEKIMYINWHNKTITIR